MAHWTLKPDGADWRCSECEQRFPARDVILFEHTETKERALICLVCVDEEWLASSQYMGEK